MANVRQSNDAPLIVGPISLKEIGQQYNNGTSTFHEENGSTRVFCANLFKRGGRAMKRL